jgi:hypothetical protein
MSENRDHLYGLPDAEWMRFDPSEIVEEYLTDADEDEPLAFTIEEWSVHTPRYHLPQVDRLLEWISEWASENGETGEDCEIGESAPEVQAAAAALLDAVAATIYWRMADRKLRDLHVTGTHDNPLIDGEPVWVSSPPKKGE